VGSAVSLVRRSEVSVALRHVLRIEGYNGKSQAGQIDAPSSSTSGVERANAAARGCASTDISKTAVSQSELRPMSRMSDLLMN